MQQELILNEALAEGLNLIGERWTLMILREAFYGTTRFDEFIKSTGISRATLTRRLSTLTEAGIFRKQAADSGLRKEYLLSKKGASLIDASLLALQWESDWNQNARKAKTVEQSLVHKSCNRRLRPKVTCAACGESLSHSQIQWLDSKDKLDEQFSSIKASHKRTRRRISNSLVASEANLIELIADRWSLLILIACFFSVSKFDGFTKQLNIPSSILSERLKLLTECKLLVKEEYASNPPRFDYQLTEKGRSVFPFVMALRQWVNETMLGEQANPSLIHKTCGHPLRIRVVCSACDQAPLATEISF